jgi:hypothetical protein
MMLAAIDTSSGGSHGISMTTWNDMKIGWWQRRLIVLDGWQLGDNWSDWATQETIAWTIDQAI